jgi:hypothetical protein
MPHATNAPLRPLVYWVMPRSIDSPVAVLVLAVCQLRARQHDR